jgi:hypothetical protein
MQQTNEKQTIVLNLVLILLSLGSLAVAALTAIENQFKGGTDDLFLILVCLLLALLFAINPLVWAASKGWLRNPLKRHKQAQAEQPAEKEKAAVG